ncbi:hypothetical protein [Polyangium jinanense]|uniref:DUF3352 domain-containing protein n=1 Tax=Polyangium jinanense TaxID=2829994 RepID=A0A9X3WZG3_9BACT|nr:hypothetical protein [Polyangium jinanense]MDC3955041.1 hypothetical protein [Polyangium jinanense]MDC3981189.1 hypothetical protein [Polyangium jinanense]
MADTLVDPIEPVPPTQRDPDALGAAPAPAPEAPAVAPPEPPPESPPEPPPEPRAEAPRPKPRTSRIVLVAVAAVFVVAAIAALVFWNFVLRYRPTARAHVPAGTNVAIRIEAADLVLFGPVREHLLKLALDEGSTPEASAPSRPSRASRIHDHTGVRLPADLREVVVASMDGKSWVALLGGRIEHGRFVKGLAEVAREEGWTGFRREGELFVGPSIVIGQADDGTILVGTDRSIVEAALPATEEGQKLGLPEKGAVTFAIARQAFEALSGTSAITPRASALGTVERATGTLALGSSPELVVRLEPTKAADAPKLEEATRALLSDLGLALLLVPDVAGEKEALRATTVKREGDVVVLRAAWPYAGLDRAAETLAGKLRGAEIPDKKP